MPSKYECLLKSSAIESHFVGHLVGKIIPFIGDSMVKENGRWKMKIIDPAKPNKDFSIFCDFVRPYSPMAKNLFKEKGLLK